MYRKMLAPIDVSEPSSWAKALPVALELARTFLARIHATTVVRDVDAIWRAQYSVMSYDSMISHAETELAGILAKAFPKDVSVEFTVGRGSIYSEILRIADDIGADLIVMASHRPEMRSYLTGANAAKVVQHARCSALVVREA